MIRCGERVYIEWRGLGQVLAINRMNDLFTIRHDFGRIAHYSKDYLTAVTIDD